MSYKTGIVKAISDLKDRTGSSLSAIKKNMQASLPSTKKWGNTTFLTALKSSVIAGDLLQVKGSYKLSPEFKKKIADAAKPKKKAAPKKTAAPKKKKAAPKKKHQKLKTTRTGAGVGSSASVTLADSNGGNNTQTE